MIQRGQSKSGSAPDQLPLPVRPGGLQLFPQLAEKEAPEGILSRPGPELLPDAGLIPKLQGTEAAAQCLSQGGQIHTGLPGAPK